jgi:hypothetical protein
MQSSPAPLPNPKVFVYNTGTGAVGTDATFFTNSNSGGCPVTACTIYYLGCLIPYATQYPTGKLTLTSLTITATTTHIAGWSEIICVSCTTDIGAVAQDTATWDSYTVTQSPFAYSSICGAGTPNVISAAAQTHVLGFEIGTPSLLTNAVRYLTIP